MHGVKLTTLPVIRMENGVPKGADPQTLETVMPGEQVLVRVSLPTTGFMTSDEIHAYLAFICQFPHRSLGGARNIESGLMTMTHFVDHGHILNDILRKNPGVKDFRALFDAQFEEQTGVKVPGLPDQEAPRRRGPGRPPKNEPKNGVAGKPMGFSVPPKNPPEAAV
jgi:hypothetical protein